MYGDGDGDGGIRSRSHIDMDTTECGALPTLQMA